MAQRILDLPAHIYHKEEGESFSSLKNFLVSPQHYFEMKKNPFTGNYFTKMGTAVHLYLQNSPHLVLSCDFTGKKLEEVEKAHEEETKGEGVVVPSRVIEIATAIEANSKANDKIMQIRNTGTVEVSYTFSYDGVLLRGRADFEGEDYITDIKTSSKCISRESFAETARAGHYDLQAAIYKYAFELIHGRPLKNYYFIPAHTRGEYEVTIYKASDDFLDSGERKLKKVSALYKKYVINKEPIEDVEEI